MSKSSISHQGVVASFFTDKIQVRITSVSACSSCHVKGACGMSDMKEKIIDATPNGKNYKIGEVVTVTAKESIGFKALFLGYLLPLLIVLVVLIVATSMKIGEAKSGILALITLFPYYGILFILRDRIKKSFVFEIKQ